MLHVSRERCSVAIANRRNDFCLGHRCLILCDVIGPRYLAAKKKTRVLVLKNTGGRVGFTALLFLMINPAV